MAESRAAFPPATLRLALPCRLGEVRRAASAVHDFLTQQGCAADERADCELVLIEACNNAIKHAPKNAGGDAVIIEASCHLALIELRITDHTPGFDWPNHVSLPHSESESGRGLFLIRSLTDESSYHRQAAGNVLVLRKKRRPHSGSAGCVSRK